MLNDKLKNGRYEFISKVFNLPSCRTISEYNSVGGNSSDGILHDVLKKLRSNLDGDGDDWHKHVSLKWDACHIAEKVVFNSHTNRLVGFTHDAFDGDVLLQELSMIKEDVEEKELEPKRAKQYLIFMISNWERNCH